MVIDTASLFMFMGAHKSDMDGRSTTYQKAKERKRHP